MKKQTSPSAQRLQHNQQSASGLFKLLSRPLWTGALLAIITTVVYWPAVGFDYVNYDDPQFITTNPHVLGGLTWENVRWAFGTGMDGNWIPLTWLSYMLDMEWSGPTATGLHLTNILLHAANTVLVFLLFRQLTGAHWQSAVLAGLFGLHPLHVESVAWVAERKDVLSTLFWSLAIWMYARYAKKVAAGSRRWPNEYIAGLDFFCVGFDVQTHVGNPAVRAVAAGLLAAAAHRTRRYFLSPCHANPVDLRENPVFHARRHRIGAHDFRSISRAGPWYHWRISRSVRESQMPWLLMRAIWRKPSGRLTWPFPIH